MTENRAAGHGSAAGRAWRVGVTMAAIVLVEALVCGISALPVVSAWWWLAGRTTGHPALDIAVVSLLLAPSYVAFAVALIFVSPAATWLTGARTPAPAEMRIAEASWPLMRWARYMSATHVVRTLAGPLLRGTQVWTFYMRLNGARIGRRVFVNSLAVSDHSLLDFGDDAVIGGDVHLSGHTVEHGTVITAPVRLGPHVTIGLGSVVEVGVIVGAHGQVGALSFVPKHTVIEEGAVYAGVPVKRIK
jgi:acetyltransferase-like isoleucine patch superfamily enzyme